MARRPRTINLRSAWAPLASAAAFLTGLVVVFISTPARLWSDAPPSTALRFTQFVLAVIVGLTVYATRRPPSPRSKMLWLICAIITLVVGVSAYFSYQLLSDSWTCDYAGRGPVVIGKTHTPATAKYLQENPIEDCSRLIASFSGKTPEIWERGEIITRHFALTVLFSVSVLLLSFSAVSMIQFTR
jgi:hypothetical protein